MRLFHISDLLSATTGRLVSSRHMDGIYDIYNFLTGDSLFTHQLPRAADGCRPWLATQFPAVMEDSPLIAEWLPVLDESIALCVGNRAGIERACVEWVESVRVAAGLPEMVPVYEMGADMHTRINPIEELRAMVGDDKVIVIDTEVAK